MSIPVDEVNAFFSSGEPPKPTEPPKPAPRLPADIVSAWRDEGPLVRIPTGIAPLDELCRGGLPIPWRVFIIGAPSAGKTFVSTVIADTMAKRLEAEGICVGILGVDEEPDDLTVRMAQMAGFSVEEAEARAEDILDAMAEKLSTLNVHLYDATFTIEAAGADLAGRAKAQGKRAALFVDSIHAAKSAAAMALETDSVRLIIEANVAAIRSLATTHRMLVVATAEANRASYRTEAASDEVNDMASGAESRAIEFAGQTLLMLRTPKGHRDITHVRVPKNRRAQHGEFWLRLDRERHTMAPCPNPADEPGAAEESAQKKRTANRRALEQEARAVLRIVAAHPGIGTNGLRAGVKLAGLKMGKDTLDATLLLLTRSGRVQDRPVQRGSFVDHHYYGTPGAQDDA